MRVKLTYPEKIQNWNSSWFNGEGNGNPLQYSCLENPMDGGTWWAIVHGIAESDTTERLNWLTDWNLALEPALWWMTTEHDYYRLRCKWRIMVSVMAGVYWSLTHQVFFGTCYLLWPVQFSQQVSEKGVLLPVRHGRVNNLTKALQLLIRGGRTWT